MSGDTIGQMLYLGLLGAAVLGWFIVQNRGQPGKMAQQAAIWGLIFVGVIAAIGLWSDIRRSSMRLPVVAENRIEIPRGPDGHFHLDLLVNDVPVAFMIDTGATNIVLSRQDAVRAGIDVARLRFLGEAVTANGVVRTARVRLDSMTIGPFTERAVTAYVNSAEMEGSLLGMDYLSRFPEVTIRTDLMILSR